MLSGPLSDSPAAENKWRQQRKGKERREKEGGRKVWRWKGGEREGGREGLGFHGGLYKCTVESIFTVDIYSRVEDVRHCLEMDTVFLLISADICVTRALQIICSLSSFGLLE